MVDHNKFKAPILVTVSYFVMYYVFLYLQSAVGHIQFYLAKKKAKSEAEGKGEQPKKVSYAAIKYGSQSQDRLSLTALRSIGNTMEQAFPFLTAVWLHAVFVSPERAAFIGWVYIAARSYYPIGFYFGVPFVLFSTLPGYACIFLLFYEVVTK